VSPNDPQRAEIAEVGEEAIPLPADTKVVYLGGIFFILLLAALYAVAEIVWPLVFAFILSLLLKPPMRLLARLRFPRVLCALLLVVAVLGLVEEPQYPVPLPVGRQNFPKACRGFSSASDFSKRLSVRCSIFGNR